ncbi:MAG: gliding motility lipoprotein GldH [Saprospiraceae bacterium]|nr:gliding motility lipoprotein GldH [Saprospiraceae bacterium]
MLDGGIRLLLLLLGLSWYACSEKTEFSSSIEIPGSQWSYDQHLIYSVDVQDTSARYDLVMDVSHSTEYAYQNLYVKIHTEYPDGQSRDQQISIDMADPSGHWYGRCGRSECVLRVVLQERAFFDQIGAHQFRFEQFMRMDPVEGINTVAFKILPREQLDS